MQAGVSGSLESPWGRFIFATHPSLGHRLSLTSLESGFVSFKRKRKKKWKRRRRKKENKEIKKRNPTKPSLASPIFPSSVSEITERLGAQFGCLLSTKAINLQCIQSKYLQGFIAKFLHFQKRNLSQLRSPSIHDMKLYFASSRRNFLMSWIDREKTINAFPPDLPETWSWNHKVISD